MTKAGARWVEEAGRKSLAKKKMMRGFDDDAANERRAVRCRQRKRSRAVDSSR